MNIEKKSQSLKDLQMLLEVLMICIVDTNICKLNSKTLYNYNNKDWNNYKDINYGDKNSSSNNYLSFDKIFLWQEEA